MRVVRRHAPETGPARDRHLRLRLAVGGRYPKGTLMALGFLAPRHWEPREVCLAVGHAWCVVFGLVACCDRCLTAVMVSCG